MSVISFAHGNSGNQVGVNYGTIVLPPTKDSPTNSVDHFNVPIHLTHVPLIENFIGRHDEMNHLWLYLNPKDSRSRKVAILHGLGGIGKTQLAVCFARKHKHDFTAIFWLSGKDRATLLQSLSSVLPRLPGKPLKNEAANDDEIEQRARDVLEWLTQDGNSRWSIIFDNIDQYSPIDSGVRDAYDITKFFPAADHGSILITTRLSGLTQLGESFPIPKLESTEAIQLLLNNSGLSKSNTVEKLKRSPDTLALAERLDGLPLAIVIAAAFMRETGTSITQYLEYYQQSWSDLQSQSSPGRQYQQGNILQTWMISYHEIWNRDPNAAKLLLLLAHFDNRDIWYELVQSASNSLDVPEWLKKAITNRLGFQVCVKPLIEFSLLETNRQDGSYAIHPVVQDWCYHMTSIGKIVNPIQLFELALISIGYSVPNTNDRNYAELERRLLPHAAALRNNQFFSDNITLWRGFHGLGVLYSDQGKLKEAEKMYQRALAGKEKALGPNHTSTLDTVNNLGNVYSDQGKLKEAEEMYQRALAGKEEAFGPDHMSTLDTVNNLSILYKDQGKLKEAEEMHQRALAGKEKALGPDHTSTLDTVNNLGNVYSKQGKLKEAEEMYQRALAGKEEALGLNHTSTLDTVNNLGLLYFNKGKLKEAEEMYQRALAGKQEALGPNHTSTLDIVNNLGNVYKDQGKLKEAEEMYQRALVGKQEALGLDHTSTLMTVNNLGNLYRDQGKLKEVERMYQQALAGYEKALGLDHTSTLSIVNNLGNLYKDQGKLKEAEEMYQRALVGKQETLGPDHISTLRTVNNLGNLYKDQGKLKEAEEMYQRALAGKEKALGPNHTSTLRAVNNLSLLYKSQGKLEDAKGPYREGVQDNQNVAQLKANKVRRAIGRFSTWFS